MIHCKRGVTLRSTAEWEKENTPTHTHAYWHTEGFQQTLPKKGQKGQKKNKNKVNTVKNLKKGTQCFNFKFQQPSLLARRTGEERKITMIIQQTSMRCNGAIVLWAYSLVYWQIWKEIAGSNTGPLIPTQQLDTICRSLICPQSRMLT